MVLLHTSWCPVHSSHYPPDLLFHAAPSLSLSLPQSLDYETVRNLELLASARAAATAGTPASSGGASSSSAGASSRGAPRGAGDGSLFGVLNHTKTSVGARLLRAQLLSPCTDGPTLTTRLDCVAELLQSESVWMGLTAALPRLCDLDALLSQVSRVRADPVSSICGGQQLTLLRYGRMFLFSLPVLPAHTYSTPSLFFTALYASPPQFVSTPKVSTPRTARRSVASLILLKATLETLPAVASPLEGATNPLLRAIRANLASPGECKLLRT